MKRGLVMALLLVLFTPAVTLADSMPTPRPYTVEILRKGEYVLVLLPKETSEMYERIHSRYPQSGLYRNDGSPIPLWTIEPRAFFVYTSRFDISSDGRYMAVTGPWPGRGDYAEVAVLFYDSGQLIREYRVSDLVQDPSSLPESVSHYRWLRSVSFNDMLGRLTIVTLNNEAYVFDIASGAIIEGRDSTGVPTPGAARETVVAGVLKGTPAASTSREGSSALPFIGAAVGVVTLASLLALAVRLGRSRAG